MTRGQRLACPHIVVFHSNQPKYASRDEAWAAVGPILARILAQIIAYEQEEQERKTKATRKREASV